MFIHKKAQVHTEITTKNDPANILASALLEIRLDKKALAYLGIQKMNQFLKTGSNVDKQQSQYSAKKDSTSAGSSLQIAVTIYSETRYSDSEKQRSRSQQIEYSSLLDSR